MLNYPTTFIPQIYKKEIDNCNFMKGYLLFNVKTKRMLSLSYKSKENKVFLKWLSG